METDEQLTAETMSFGKLAGYAWRRMNEHKGLLVGAMLLTTVISVAASLIPYLGNFASLLLFPLSAGYMLLCLTIVRREEASIQMLFHPFSDYLRYLWGAIRVGIFVFLWSLLLIIPGVVAMYRYSMTFYLMLDHPEYSVKQAMMKSSEITKGYKWRMFGYGLCFSLIFAVPFVVLGILVVWLIWQTRQAVCSEMTSAMMLIVLAVLVVIAVVGVIVWLLATIWPGLFTAGIYESIREKTEIASAPEIPEQFSIDAGDV